jgi:hypothetical protein
MLAGKSLFISTGKLVILCFSCHLQSFQSLSLVFCLSITPGSRLGGSSITSSGSELLKREIVALIKIWVISKVDRTPFITN